jgi:hypothetical protein
MEARVGCMHDAEINTLLNLKVARDRKGRAPNKPLLVLAILDLVEPGLLAAMRVPVWRQEARRRVVAT